MVALYFHCKDVTGEYESVVIIERHGQRYIGHYCDFDNVVCISPNRRGLDIWIPNILRTLLANESGIVPVVKLARVEYLYKEETLAF